MISGATRGKGGRNLSAHLLKAEGDQITTVITPRGIVTKGDLHAQLAELVAGSAHGRTDRPCYHVHADPPPEAADSYAVLTAWWKAFEREFKLTEATYVGAQHVKHGRAHEHRVYSLVKPSGRVIDVSMDFQRRSYVNYSVAFELGLEPVRSPHARACQHRFVADGRPDIAAWLEAHGTTEGESSVALLTPEERLIQERTGIPRADLQALALEAWNASSDGPGFQRELAARGLQLMQGNVGPVIVDKSGTAHALTRIVGTASRLADNRIPAATVKARVSELNLERHHATAVGPDRERALGTQVPDVGPGKGADAGRGRAGPGRRPRTDLGAPRAGGRPAEQRSSQGRHLGERLAASGRRAFARARLNKLLVGVDWRRVHAAGDLAEELRVIVSQKQGPWVPGMTDMWGVPLR